MNKSILIINTPENCYNCKFEYDCYKCGITNSSFFGHEDFDPCKDVLSDCPLKKIPEKYVAAIEVLDKQIPAKIVKTFDRGDYWCSCPVCCKGLGWEHNVNIKYCPECGQRLEKK